LERPDGLQVPEGKFYLVDASYAFSSGFVPPFGSTRYLLNEFSTIYYPKNSKEHYLISDTLACE
jgi:hypothetical protein